MNENGHDACRLLKLNIEGAEYKVLESVLRDKLDVGILCIQYDEANWPLDPDWKSRVRGSLEALMDKGLVPVAMQVRCNYTLLHQSLLEDPAPIPTERE